MGTVLVPFNPTHTSLSSFYMSKSHKLSHPISFLDQNVVCILVFPMLYMPVHLVLLSNKFRIKLLTWLYISPELHHITMLSVTNMQCSTHNEMGSWSISQFQNTKFSEVQNPETFERILKNFYTFTHSIA